ncbi:MAG: DUF1295 domain-containing protein, partial [Fidelibacterota bacterium]
LSAGLIILAYVTAVWILSLLVKNTGIMDIFWGPGFVLVSAWYFLATDGYDPRRWLIISLVALWGFRLAGYILLRSKGQPEDPRYHAWRLAGGSYWWWQSYLKVFILQGLILWIISMPLLAAVAAVEPAYVTWMEAVGVLLWFVGFLFEAIGDWQLYRFKQDPASKGRVLDTGLWAYTRHPNYFGEALIWWGYGFIALSFGTVMVLVSPLVMTLLLLRVSGVAMLEKLLVDSKPEYVSYIRNTSAFIPWFKKKSEASKS